VIPETKSTVDTTFATSSYNPKKKLKLKSWNYICNHHCPK